VTPKDAYARTGVSQRQADAAVEALVGHLSRINPGRPSRVVPLPGHYASVVRVDERLGIAMATDGVGTKMVVAERLGRFDTVGIDCIAMNANDLICVGAEPIALLDLILCRQADPESRFQAGRSPRSATLSRGGSWPAPRSGSWTSTRSCAATGSSRATR
jgi:phosphoribosylformylglycinamidine cyclo-ligase